MGKSLFEYLRIKVHPDVQNIFLTSPHHSPTTSRNLNTIPITRIVIIGKHDRMPPSHISCIEKRDKPFNWMCPTTSFFQGEKGGWKDDGGRGRKRRKEVGMVMEEEVRRRKVGRMMGGGGGRSKEGGRVEVRRSEDQGGREREEKRVEHTLYMQCFPGLDYVYHYASITATYLNMMAHSSASAT
jgi:hypothetical protein